MRAVSVFTCEELPSPTLFLSEILPLFRDVINSLFLVRMSFFSTVLRNELLLSDVKFPNGFDMTSTVFSVNESVRYNRTSRKSASR